uniref:GRDP C2 domain-containing protein n=1 Tax=Kalanchoe fedtschenkoi TaxID=63787 RepID=A0A7N0U4P0_KALFE
MSRVQGDDSWSLKCELRILEARNVELKHSSELFVRCYLSGGNNTRVPINTQQISSESSHTLHWGECFSLECSGDSNFIETLRHEKVVLELRRRSAKRSVFKTFRSSNLIGTAQVAWKTVFESADMKMEQWFPLALKDGVVAEGFKPPMLRVGMKIQAASTMKEGQRERSRRLRSWDECGCKYGGCCCVDDDLFLVLGASMFEAL